MKAEIEQREPGEQVEVLEIKGEDGGSRAAGGPAFTRKLRLGRQVEPGRRPAGQGGLGNQ
jgi:hypothetical protein